MRINLVIDVFTNLLEYSCINRFTYVNLCGLILHWSIAAEGAQGYDDWVQCLVATSNNKTNSNSIGYNIKKKQNHSYLIRKKKQRKSEKYST